MVSRVKSRMGTCMMEGVCSLVSTALPVSVRGSSRTCTAYISLACAHVPLLGPADFPNLHRPAQQKQKQTKKFFFSSRTCKFPTSRTCTHLYLCAASRSINVNFPSSIDNQGNCVACGLHRSWCLGVVLALSAGVGLNVLRVCWCGM